MDVKESHKQWKKINSGKFIERLVFIAFCFVICALIIAFKYYILIPFRSNHNNSSTKIPKVKTGKHINKNFIKQENKIVYTILTKNTKQSNVNNI